MIFSMTGYGQGEHVDGEFRVTAETRSFNSRFLDIAVRLPKSLAGLEQKVRDLVRRYVVRGHVNVTVRIRNGEDRAVALRVDLPAARTYVRLLSQLKQELDLPGDIQISHLLNFPELIAVEEDDAEGTEQLWEPIREAVTGALVNLRAMRREEGRLLENDLRDRVEQLESLLEQTERAAVNRRDEHFSKLRDRVSQLLSDEQIDEDRLYTELALMVDRMDVTEECVRFHSHNHQFLQALEVSEPVGRRLNFLLQEMNREATTIGSKAYSAEISHLVVLLKEEIERMREQVQNIE